MSTNNSNQNSPKSLKKELPHTSLMFLDNVNVDQFAIDLYRYFFFKLPGVRREDYRGVFELTDVKHIML